MFFFSYIHPVFNRSHINLVKHVPYVHLAKNLEGSDTLSRGLSHTALQDRSCHNSAFSNFPSAEATRSLYKKLLKSDCWGQETFVPEISIKFFSFLFKKPQFKTKVVSRRSTKSARKNIKLQAKVKLFKMVWFISGWILLLSQSVMKCHTLKVTNNSVQSKDNKTAALIG